MIELIAAGASLLGGALDRKQRRREIAANRPVALRKEYEKAGLNPLVGFTNGVGQFAPMAANFSDGLNRSAEALTDHFAEKAEAQAKLDEARQELQETREELTEARMANGSGQTLGQALGATLRSDQAEYMGSPSEMALSDIRPTARPTAATMERVPVFGPYGQRAMVPKTWADRMGVTPFSYLAAGEYSELVGEIVGEGAGMLFAKEIGDVAGFDLIRDDNDGYNASDHYEWMRGDWNPSRGARRDRRNGETMSRDDAYWLEQITVNNQ